MTQTGMYAIDIMAFFMILGSFAWGMRWYYSRIDKPSKKAPYGKVVGVWVTETGDRHSDVVAVWPAGPGSKEVKAPRGHDVPRYFFDKYAIQWTWYPDFMPFRVLQTKVALVEWPENDPEPIRPHHNDARLVSSDYMGFIDNKSSFQVMIQSAIELAEIQKQLLTALAAKLNKNVVYLLLGVAVLAAIIAVILEAKNMASISDIRQAWGI